MKFAFRLVLTALIAVAGGVSRAQAQAPNLDLMDIVLKSVPDGPVAIVAGAAISSQEFKDLYMGEVLRWAQMNPGKQVDDEVRLGIAMNGLRMLIEREVLYQEALKRKLTIPDSELEAKWQAELAGMKKASAKEGQPEPSEADVLKLAGVTREQALTELRKAMLVEKLRETIMNEKGVTVSGQEVADWYEQNKNLTRRPDLIHLKQIFIQADKNRKDAKKDAARQRADEAYQRIQSGQSFEGVAKAVSDGRYKEDGGDWGTRPVGEFPPFIVDAANKLKPGEVSQPIASEYGYHILKLVEAVPGAETPLEKAAPDVRRMLMAKKGAQAVREFTSKVIGDPKTLQVFLDLEKQIELRPGLREKLAEGVPATPPPAAQPKKEKQ